MQEEGIAEGEEEKKGEGRRTLRNRIFKTDDGQNQRAKKTYLD